MRLIRLATVAKLLLLAAAPAYAGSITLTGTLQQSYCAGSKIVVTWNYSAPLTSTSEISVLVSSDGGATYEPLPKKAVAGAKSFAWQVPTSQTPSTKYRLKFVSSSGSAQTAVFTIVRAPTITQQPKNAIVSANATHTFTAVASVDDASYQWFRNGVAVPGATASSLEVVATYETTGAYTVTVTNGCSSTTSMTAALSIS